MVSHSFHSA